MIKSSNSEITIKFTEKEIGIIKASLQYYVLDINFGGSMWFSKPGATWGRSDNHYLFLTKELQEKISKVSKNIKADFGDWGNIKRLADLCKKEYNREKRKMGLLKRNTNSK